MGGTNTSLDPIPNNSRIRNVAMDGWGESRLFKFLPASKQPSEALETFSVSVLELSPLCTAASWMVLPTRQVAFVKKHTNRRGVNFFNHRNVSQDTRALKAVFSALLFSRGELNIEYRC